MQRVSRGRRLLLLACPLCSGFVLTACLKTLDESLIDANRPDASPGGSGGLAGQGASGGVGASGGTAGDGGGSGGSGGGSSGGSAGQAGGGGTGGPPEPTFTSWEDWLAGNRTERAVLDLQGSLTPPVLVAADAQNAYRVTKGAVAEPQSTLVSVPVPVTTGPIQIFVELKRPQSLIAPTSTSFLFVAAGSDTQLGTLWRIDKGGAGGDEVVVPDPIELAVGIVEGTENTIYATAKTSAAGMAAVLSFPYAGAAQTLYTSIGPESGGDITQAGDCVYWISEGRIWMMQKTGGDRVDALDGPITNAIGITSDSANFYYTRGNPGSFNGQVWQRPLSDAACLGSAEPEKLIASGFRDPGDVIAFPNTGPTRKVAWPADDYLLDGTSTGPGIFMTTVDGIDITQIAPGDEPPDQIAQSPSHIVFSTTAKLRAIKKPP